MKYLILTLILSTQAIADNHPVTFCQGQVEIAEFVMNQRQLDTPKQTLIDWLTEQDLYDDNISKTIQVAYSYPVFNSTEDKQGVQTMYGQFHYYNCRRYHDE